MKIRLCWVFQGHGGIEWEWRGEYKVRQGVAIGRAGRGEPEETLQIAIEGDQVRAFGGSLDGVQVGRIWRRDKKGRSQ